MRAGVLESVLGVLSMFMFFSSASGQTAPAPEERARRFVAQHEAQVRPLEIAVNLAWWNANTSGKDEDFQAKEQAQNRLDAALANPEKFGELRAIKESHLQDPLLARQIDVLYLAYLEKQVDPTLLQRITAKSNAIEKAFNAYRAPVGDRTLTDSEVRRILSESHNSAERQAAWEGSKGVGSVVAADLKELVNLRNEAARRLGFANYHALQLSLNEQDPQQVLKLFDELDALTRGPFARIKAQIDQRLAAQCGVAVTELRPWHYQDPFFQEAPNIYDARLDDAFAQANILDICQRFYAGIGLPIDDVLTRSDLYEKPGKSPHAFCTDIDRQGDVRVLANIVPNEYWMATMLHELGHSVYSSRNIPESMPYVLRTEAHILTTEGVAMMFERFSKNAQWVQAAGVPLADPRAYEETASRMRRDQLLIFSRWCQVMYRFEMSMYENPNQDLNKLWWDLAEMYQSVRRPPGRNAPDYASKIHIVTAPAYYHNYMLGQLFACQLHRTIARQVLKAEDPVKAFYWNDPRVGAFMKQRVFAPGRSLPWDRFTEFATGEPLSAKAFAAEFGGP